MSKKKKPGLFSIPEDIIDEMKSNVNTAWDEVRANQYLRKHGMEEYRNKGFSLKEAKKLVNGDNNETKN